MAHAPRQVQLCLTSLAAPPPPPRPLTTLAGGPVLRCALAQGLLLPVVVFVGFAVSARTGADAALKGPAAQHLSTGGGRGGGHNQNHEPRGPAPQPCEPYSPSPPTSQRGILTSQGVKAELAAPLGHQVPCRPPKAQLLLRQPLQPGAGGPSLLKLTSRARIIPYHAPDSCAAPSSTAPSPCRASPTPHARQTHSRVSRVMMMRMGRRFMPPTQLLLHMKLYRMVVNSVPTCTWGGGCQPAGPKPLRWGSQAGS